MHRVFLSFLGTNNYLPCVYYREGFESGYVRFVQEATLKLCCRDWDAEDRVLIFTTEEARSRNWEDDGHLDYKTGEPLRERGLKNCIKDMKLSAAVERVDIPQGKSEVEIWDIFSKVYDQLSEGDHVVFDITHAFRSIPMLAVVVLNYAKVMKGVLLNGIYYGAFEVLGSIPEASAMRAEDRRAPILDLTAFDQLMDWTTAIDRFIGGGDGRSIHKLAMQNIQPIMRQTEGQDESAARIKRMADTLVAFTNALATCRGPEISGIGMKLQDKVAACKEIDFIRPLQPLLSLIAEQTACYRGNIIDDGIHAVRWCLEHNLVQQGVTILWELIFSHAILCAEGDCYDIETRNIASQSLSILSKKLRENEDEWHSPAKEKKEITRQLIAVFNEKKDLIKLIEALRQLRNDINHAGFSPHNKKVKDAKMFKKRLEKALEGIDSYLASLR